MAGRPDPLPDLEIPYDWLQGPPRDLTMSLAPLAHRYTDAELADLSNAPDPGIPVFGARPPGARPNGGRGGQPGGPAGFNRQFHDVDWPARQHVDG